MVAYAGGLFLPHRKSLLITEMIMIVASTISYMTNVIFRYLHSLLIESRK